MDGTSKNDGGLAGRKFINPLVTFTASDSLFPFVDYVANATYIRADFLLNAIFSTDNLRTVQLVLIMTSFVVTFSIVKILYSTKFSYFTYIPEPITVLGFGLAFGKIAVEFNLKLQYFNQVTFFTLFLPSIIFEAVLHLQKVYFVRNISVVLMFGVVGTFMNFSLLTCCLWLLSLTSLFKSEGLHFSPAAFYLLAILLTSVSTVMVLSVLGEMQVDPSLYFIFVGESVINDGITLLIFGYVYSLSCRPHILGNENIFVWTGFGAVVMMTKILGGCAIGAVFGFFTCFLTKFTVSCPTIEPLLILSTGYGLYLFCFGISWDGVFALMVFGLIQTSYSFENISTKSKITVKRFAHMASEIAESLIFLVVGYTVIVDEHEWRTYFILLSFLLCTVMRFFVVYFLSGLANYFRVLPTAISPTQKFVISFCGLRGVIGHSLVEVVDPKCLTAIGISPPLLQTATIFITFFSVMFIGLTMRPLLRLFKMKSKRQPISLFLTLSEEVLIKMKVCVQEIAIASEGNALLDQLAKWDQKYIRPVLLRDPTPPDHILNAFAKVTEALHYASLAADEARANRYLSKVQLSSRNIPALSLITLTNLAADRISPRRSSVFEPNYSPMVSHFSKSDSDLARNLRVFEAKERWKKQKKDRCLCCRSRAKYRNHSIRFRLSDTETPPMYAASSGSIDRAGKKRNRESSASPANSFHTSPSVSYSEAPSCSFCGFCRKLCRCPTKVQRQEHTRAHEMSLIFREKRYVEPEEVTYTDRLRYAIRLKQSAIRLQQLTASTTNLFRGMLTALSVDRLPNIVRTSMVEQKRRTVQLRTQRRSSNFTLPPNLIPQDSDQENRDTGSPVVYRDY
ncbi:unnamed protein product [Calicophoron daubneyi]|uniref:Sodium/hydrogen exchanger n=1 Tax=Calicophoron daubneyi TaxID=300641 RepID=A0AAV2TAQ5_CALDB